MESELKRVERLRSWRQAQRMQLSGAMSCSTHKSVQTCALLQSSRKRSEEDAEKGTLRRALLEAGRRGVIRWVVRGADPDFSRLLRRFDLRPSRFPILSPLLRAPNSFRAELCWISLFSSLPPLSRQSTSLTARMIEKNQRQRQCYSCKIEAERRGRETLRRREGDYNSKKRSEAV